MATARHFIDRVSAVLAPCLRGRGHDWELHVDETPFEYWAINGIFPPREGTPDDARWRAENRPSPRTHD
ncbi:tautomerase family protein [Camelimonas abortus]|uniref:Tautomerase family protein n=1 Tax=Camelimonas abortus TaxID=1017184 RepID=A0ABV7LCD6_9HYPH